MFVSFTQVVIIIWRFTIIELIYASLCVIHLNVHLIYLLLHNIILYNFSKYVLIELLAQ